MKRSRLILAATVVIAAMVILFGAGGCCVFLTPHHCAKKSTDTELEPTPDTFTANGITHKVYDFGGSGPDVILLHELPGLSVQTVKLAKMLGKEPQHYSVHVPLIFGHFAKDATLAAFGKCFSEFNCLGNGDSRFSDWLRALIKQRYGGRHVVVIGMCMTGSVALEVADTLGVVGVVMAQPSLPLPFTRWQRPKIGVTDKHACQIKSAGTPILAMRYSEDCLASAERFDTLRTTFPAQIEFEEVPSGACEKKAHATLTGDFSDQAYAHLRLFLKTHAKP